MLPAATRHPRTVEPALISRLCELHSVDQVVERLRATQSRRREATFRSRPGRSAGQSPEPTSLVNMTLARLRLLTGEVPRQASRRGGLVKTTPRCAAPEIRSGRGRWGGGNGWHGRVLMTDRPAGHMEERFNRNAKCGAHNDSSTLTREPKVPEAFEILGGGN